MTDRFRLTLFVSFLKRSAILFGLFGLIGCSLIDRQGPPEILGVQKSPQADAQLAAIDTLRIRIQNENLQRDTVGRGQAVDLTLFSLDPDNDELDYQWTARRIGADDFDSTVTSGLFEISNNDTLVNLFQDSVTVTWVAPGELGEIELKVVISDGISGVMDSSVVQVEVTQGPPVASAGGDALVSYSDDFSLELDGSGSSDPDADQLSYVWEQIAGPRLSLDRRVTATPSVVRPPPADYVFTLIVRDDGLRPELALESAPDTVRVRISDRSGRGG